MSMPAMRTVPEVAARKLAQHNISALPVVDQERKVLGIVTSEDLTKLIGGQAL
jgi:CBS-domain-containing membrane protein